jgi:hypothetical protein
LVVGFVGFGKRVLPEKKTIKLTESKAPRIIPTLRDKKNLTKGKYQRDTTARSAVVQ